MVVEVGGVIVVKTVHLACNRLEESRAARARGTQHNKHLALSDNAIKTAQDINSLLVTPSEKTSEFASEG